MGSPSGSDGKESVCNAGDPGSIPGSRSSPGEGNGSPLQYSCLENPRDRRTWRATVHGGHKELDTTEQLTHTYKVILLIAENAAKHKRKRKESQITSSNLAVNSFST